MTDTTFGALLQLYRFPTLEMGSNLPPCIDGPRGLKSSVESCKEWAFGKESVPPVAASERLYSGTGFGQGLDTALIFKIEMPV
jgi:hypothetical protein